ncbi:MAG: GspE/PulE family protein [bacterium]|nr:GspE/PulE family protein [bacterium]
MVTFDEEKQKQKLEALRKSEEEELLRGLAVKYKVQYIDLTPLSINMDALRTIPENQARTAKIAAFAKVGKKLQIALTSPNNPESQKITEDLSAKGYEVQIFMATTASLEKCWNLYKDLSFATESKAGAFEISNEDVKDLLGKMRSLPDVKKILEEVLTLKKSLKVSRIVEIILAGALALKASDIHIEPEETYVRLRYRLDGVLKEVLQFDHETYRLVISRVKLISGLKLNVKTSAQDGRFSIKLEGDDIEIRTSILPGAYSESLVLRVLNPEAISVSLDEMGIPKRLFDILMREIKKPNGMLLTTGPTGSGKTTTLYSFLKTVHDPGVKIITIEDPIEYHLPGIVQTQVNRDKDYTFASGLRSALRQDPDVILVGEIRDKETASIAINAALTGHLVFSTLHTNNAAGAFPRLLDLGINPKVMLSAINAAMAQRLVRRLCDQCKKEVALEGRQKDIADKIIASLPKDAKPTNVSVVWTPEKNGCDKCDHTGYKGRIGIFEAIIADEAVEVMVLNNPSEREIKKAAAPQGILSMEQDGLLKILEGVTSFEELERVIEIDM